MILLGYWREAWPADGYPGMRPEDAADYQRRREQVMRWPDPVRFVDEAWDATARARTVRHLQVGTLVNQYRGISLCRFCDAENGTAELADGTYCWPEGLWHYVSRHDVRLPEQFVRHVDTTRKRSERLPEPRFGRLGMRDRDWPGLGGAQLLWTPTVLDHGQAYVDVDPDWWLRQGTGGMEGGEATSQA